MPPKHVIDAAPSEASRQQLRAAIRHVVVVVLENRSFDHMLGKLYPKSPAFEGLAGDETNGYVDEDGRPHTVQTWNDPGRWNAPAQELGEAWTDINEQLFGTTAPPPGAKPTMQGFARNHYRQTRPAAPDEVMFHYLPEQLPVLSTLARTFAVCDGWHASAPCQTYPNRFFLHTAGPGAGQENNPPPLKLYDMPTIFNRFKDPSDWKIYGDGLSPALALVQLWPCLARFQSMATFLADAARGRLPSYGFIECGYLIDQPNDQHPPADLRYGEAFLATIYDALRASPQWAETLLVITYDEGGGLFDHVPPPAAPRPGKPGPGQTFAFDRYGTRVPAVVVSPWIPPGTVFRAPPGTQPFDHTSIIATLRTLFDLGPALTDRDLVAPDLSMLISDRPDNPGVPVTPLPLPRSQAAEAGLLPLTPLQETIKLATSILPSMAELQRAGVVEAEALGGLRATWRWLTHPSRWL